MRQVLIRRRALGALACFSMVFAPHVAAGQGLSVLDLQPGSARSTLRATAPDSQAGQATLLNLNHSINVWYLLQLTWPDGRSESYHLENAYPGHQRLELSSDGQASLVLLDGSASHRMPLWPATGVSPLSLARRSELPYGDLWEGRVLLRNPTVGHRTRREWATDFLRDRFRYGERVTTFIKERFYRDKFRHSGTLQEQTGIAEARDDLPRPAAVLVTPKAASSRLTTPDLNLIVSVGSDGIVPGHWHAVEDYLGVFVCAVTPGLVADEVVRAQGNRVSPLDAKEESALVYLVAFDLARFELGFALGTDHPRVDWSDRVPATSRVDSLPGPDGIDSVAPLVRTGILSPQGVPRVAATFAGGFKRSHGAFKWGDLAHRNRGSHYGFIEQGTVLSTLNPGLATLLVRADGRVEMMTWPEHDAPEVESIRHARQNGVPLIETDSEDGAVRPGRLVKEWAKGNWSGSETKQLRTLRGGLGIQDGESGRWLIYGYFSAATPSAMARVFQACGCSYAMQMDINAPEHTYLALYRIEGSLLVVQRLVKEMAEVDTPVKGIEVPRFVGYPDNRDFFYLLRREPKESSQ